MALRPFAPLAVLACAACYDPVHVDAVTALGDEAPGIPPGPTHRPGQPCTTCHGGDGPADLELSVAGTLFAVRGSSVALPGGVATVTDAHGDSRPLTSNDAGNFYVPRSQWEPVFPLQAVIAAEDVRRQMITLLRRDGGCATCHRGRGDAMYMPGVFLRDK
jgi:hypothetical protein